MHRKACDLLLDTFTSGLSMNRLEHLFSCFSLIIAYRVNPAELSAAFAQHLNVFGRLDICINNAGVVEKGPFYEDTVDWRKVMDVNLTAVIEGTRLAVMSCCIGSLAQPIAW